MKKSTEVLICTVCASLNVTTLFLGAILHRNGLAILSALFVGYSFLRIAYLTQTLDKEEI